MGRQSTKRTVFDIYCHTFSLDIYAATPRILTILEALCVLLVQLLDGVMHGSPKSELMTATETSRYLKITQRTLYRYLRSRQIPAFKLGKEWRFVRSDLEQWIHDRTRTSAGS